MIEEEATAAICPIDFHATAGMTPELLQELSRYSKFPKNASELIRIAGLEAASRLIAVWGGQEWLVPMRIGGVRPAGIERYNKLARLIGEFSAQRIVQHFAGSRMQIPNLKEIKHCRIQRLVRAEFDSLTTKGGYSSPDAVFELGIKYGLTGKAIENALKRPDEDLTIPDVVRNGDSQHDRR